MIGEKPTVSVLIPVFNNEDFLASAIDSILAQEYDAVEIVVVDDGSTDGSAAIAQQYDKVRYVHQQNQGPAAARNRALEIAEGQVIAFLDADDRWPANKLDIQLARLECEPQVDIVLGRTQYVLLPGAKPRRHIEFESPEDMTLFTHHLGCGIFRRSVFEQIGDFDASISPADDLDFLLRALEAEIPLAILGEVTLLFQLHGNNTSDDINLNRTTMSKAVAKSLLRRRQPDGSIKPLPSWSEFDESQKSKA